MRRQDIEIGGTYYTRVSGERVLVEVIAAHQVASFGTRSGSSRAMWKYRVRRCDTGAELPKVRAPQSLHLTDGTSGEWPGMTEKQQRPTPGTFTAKVMESGPANPFPVRQIVIDPSRGQS